MSAYHRTFRHGDTVKYVSGQYGDHEWNPIWDGIYGQIIGTVRGNPSYQRTDNCCISVTWNNGQGNTYQHDDLRLIGELFLGDKDLML